MDLRGKKIEEGYFNLVTIEGDNVASSGALQNGQGTNVGNISVGGLSFNNANSELKLPTGTTAQRPSSPATGYLRYNTSVNSLEYYDGSGWRKVADESALEGFFFDYGTPAAAYSVRKIDVFYSGNAIKVRRSSDNTEQDIGFDSNGDLDETALLSFVGNTASDDGFVTTWYDQAGSNNAIQATAANQPKIVSAGVVVKENGKPALDFDGTSDRMSISINLAQDFSFFLLTTAPSNSQSYMIANTGGSGATPAIIANYVGSSIEHFISSGDREDIVSSTTSGEQLLMSMYFDHLTTAYLYSNGILGTNFTPVTNYTSLSYNVLASGGASNFSDIKIQELIMFHSYKYAQRTDIESNIATYFGITL